MLIGCDFLSLLFSPLHTLLPLVAALSDCYVDHLSNSIVYLLKESIESCDSYNWLVNETVVANEDSFNRTLVQSRGRSNITFFSCHNTVTYKNVCNRMTMNCSDTDTCDLAAPSYESVGIVVSVITCLFIIGCGLLIWRKCKK